MAIAVGSPMQVVPWVGVLFLETLNILKLHHFPMCQ